MIRAYENIFNTPGSKIKVDQSWKRYRHQSDSVDRTRDRYEYSVSKLYGQVLDAGAGDGFGAYLMHENKKITHITCLEIQDKAIGFMEWHLFELPHIDIVKGIIEDIPFGDNSFDSVHCGHTLEHVLDMEKALKEIRRVVRDLVVLSVPINGGVNRQHKREFKDPRDFRRIVKRYFNIIEEREFPKNDRVISFVIVGKC